MVGLSILLEAQKGVKKSPQVINKITMAKPSPFPPSSSSGCSSSSCLPAITFLDACFLCKQKLLPGKDIYMYKGDRAFCSMECRSRQIFMDEENVKENCSLAAMKVKPNSSSSSSSSSSSRHRKGTRNRAGGFAY